MFQRTRRFAIVLSCPLCAIQKLSCTVTLLSSITLELGRLTKRIRSGSAVNCSPRGVPHQGTGIFFNCVAIVDLDK
jgi:hypothetical protein